MSRPDVTVRCTPFDPARAPAVEQHACDCAIRAHVEVRLTEHFREIGRRGAAALTVECRRVIEADSVLLLTVEIVVVAQASFLRGLDERKAQRVAKTRVADL